MPLFVGASESYDTDAWEAYNLKKENAKLREELADAPKCDTCEAMLDCDECLRADESAKERKRLDYENANLRELVRDMYAVMVEDAANCDVTYPEQFDDRMRELGIEVQ